jgi:gluconolactonase
VTVLADKFEGKPLNAPNDAVVHPNTGDIWFTDPGYGTMMNYEGNKGTLEIKEAVYRIDGQNGSLHKVADEIDKPNGICFSPDYNTLYVADTGSAPYKDIKAWTVDGLRLTNRRIFTDMRMDGFGERSGNADGISPNRSTPASPCTADPGPVRAPDGFGSQHEARFGARRPAQRFRCPVACEWGPRSPRSR